MFNPFRKNQAQKEFDEALEKVLSTLHPNVYSVYDVEAFNRLMRNADMAVPLLLLILMSKVHQLADRLDSWDNDLASTVEVDLPKADQ